MDLQVVSNYLQTRSIGFGRNLKPTPAGGCSRAGSDPETPIWEEPPDPAGAVPEHRGHPDQRRREQRAQLCKKPGDSVVSRIINSGRVNRPMQIRLAFEGTPEISTGNLRTNSTGTDALLRAPREDGPGTSHWFEPMVIDA